MRTRLLTGLLGVGLLASGLSAGCATTTTTTITTPPAAEAPPVAAPSGDSGMTTCELADLPP